VKYLFKYIYKGHDRTLVVIRESDKADEEGNIDEIKQYRDARWVTPPEALWRIYGFDLSKNQMHWWMVLAQVKAIYNH
jgi:hypothetical protein